MKINKPKKQHTTAPFYSSNLVSQIFLDTNIDYSRQRLSSISIQGEYARLGIHYFKNKTDFNKYYHFKKEKREEYWKQYQYRDELIARKQYEEVKAKQYVYTLESTMEEILGEENNPVLANIIKNLNKVSASKLIDLVQIKGGKRGNFTNLLPSFEKIYNIIGTYEMDKSLSSDLEKDFAKAFAEVGLTYHRYGSEKRQTKAIIRRYGSRDVELSDYETTLKTSYRLSSLSSPYSKALGQTLRALPILSKDLSKDATLNEDKMLVTMIRAYAVNQDKIVTAKDGHQYIRFIKKEVSNRIVSSINKYFKK